MKYLWILLLLAGCHSQKSSVKVAATSVPHAQMLEMIKPEFEKEGYSLEIVVIDDYQLPNRLLHEKQVDANFFQHEPFLEKEKQEFGYDIEAISRVHIEPLCIYSKKHTTLDQLPFKAIVSIPSDPTNEARALLLLQKANLIKLKENASLLSTVNDLLENFNCLRIKEIDAPMLTRTLSDVDISVIPGNFSLLADLSEPLLCEGTDSPYTNVLVIRKEDKERKDLRLLSQLLHSEELKKFVSEKYQNKVLLSR